MGCCCSCLSGVPYASLPASAVRLSVSPRICLQVAAARNGALFQRFIVALTRGGPGGLPRPIEIHAHDPRRYVADMLAWVHQVGFWDVLGSGIFGWQVCALNHGDMSLTCWLGCSRWGLETRCGRGLRDSRGVATGVTAGEGGGSGVSLEPWRYADVPTWCADLQAASCGGRACS